VYDGGCATLAGGAPQSGRGWIPALLTLVGLSDEDFAAPAARVAGCRLVELPRPSTLDLSIQLRIVVFRCPSKGSSGPRSRACLPSSR
jgi:hypothetical protein